MPIESVIPSSHLILCCPLLLPLPIPPIIRVFSNESTLHMRWPKCWSFSFRISPSNEHPGLISFRMDWLDLLAVQGTLKSLLQYHSSKASILRHSAFFTVQLSHPYMTTGIHDHCIIHLNLLTWKKMSVRMVRFLELNWFKTFKINFYWSIVDLLCQFPLYSKVNQLCTHSTSSLFRIIFPCRSLQSIEQSSLCPTVGFLLVICLYYMCSSVYMTIPAS